LLDSRGAALLFGTADTDLIRFLAAWVQTGRGVARPSMYGPRPIRAAEWANHNYARDPLQTEYLIQEWLESHGAHIAPVSFRRTDLHAFRRAPADTQPSFCVPDFYFNCTDDQQAFQRCEEVQVHGVGGVQWRWPS